MRDNVSLLLLCVVLVASNGCGDSARSPAVMTSPEEISALDNGAGDEADGSGNEMDVSHNVADGTVPDTTVVPDLVASSCKSTKDCPDDLVCWTQAGECVDCVGDEDCPGGAECGLDHACHVVVVCTSDKDCKDMGMVCDKAAGVCVQCLTKADCPEEMFCSEAYCVPVVCEASVSQCDGLEVVTCLTDGGGWEVTDECSDNEYCDAGACHEYACLAGEVWCEGEILKSCSLDGKFVAGSEDCSESGDHCIDGECQPFVCGPGTVSCQDPGARQECHDDGMGWDVVSCEEGFCVDGECLPWVCVPGEAMCVDDTAVACDEWGMGPGDDGVDCLQNGGCCVAGACQPSVPEVCDGKDNDCDGEIDEGVLSPCGNCDPDCKLTEADPANGGFESGKWLDYDVITDEDGFLTTTAGKEMPRSLWVSNSSDNTVSRIDTDLCAETGRYHVCSNPSRTAVDLQGNVYIGCRNDGGVAKIVGNAERCFDADGNGVIDTSWDANQDGKIDATEMLPAGEDECIQYTVYPGGSCQRAVGVDADNYAWAGEWNGKKLRRLQPDTGEVVAEVALPVNPYGLVIDQAGTIWVSGRGGNKLVEVDPDTFQSKSYTSTTGCFQPYGIGLDYQGRIWIANCCCDDAALRFDPTSGTWSKSQVHGRPRGIAGRDDGKVLVANDQSSEVAVVDSDSIQTLKFLTAGSGKFPIGVALDADNDVWAVNQSASSATKFNVDTGSVVCDVPVGNGPYTYSDMTGYMLHRFTAPGLNPYHIQSFTAPGAAVTWLHLQVQASSVGCPGMTVSGRAEKDSPWITLASDIPIADSEVPFNGALPSGNAIELKLELPYQEAGCQFAIGKLAAAYQQ